MAGEVIVITDIIVGGETVGDIITTGMDIIMAIGTDITMVIGMDIMLDCIMELLILITTIAWTPIAITTDQEVGKTTAILHTILQEGDQMYHNCIMNLVQARIMTT
jgi:hypothetical protein